MYRAAIIGAGKPVATNTKAGGYQIGYTHAHAYHGNPHVTLCAVADIAPSHLEAFTQQFAVTGYTDYREMLAQERPDIVSICTYVGLHAEMIEAALDVGVPMVFCEKPFVATPRQYHHITHRLSQSTSKLAIAHVRRYLPVFTFARDWCQNGNIGTPVACMAGIADWDLSEWGSHWIDMYRYLLGEEPVSWVMAQARVRDARGFGHAMEDHAILHIGFAHGARGILDGGQAMAGGDIMTIVGTQGSIHVHDEASVTLHDGQGRTRYDVGHQMDWPGCWDAAVADLVRWMSEGTMARIGFPRVSESAAVNLAAYVSMVKQDRIDFPWHDQDPLDQWPLELLARPR